MTELLTRRQVWRNESLHHPKVSSGGRLITRVNRRKVDLDRDMSQVLSDAMDQLVMNFDEHG